MIQVSALHVCLRDLLRCLCRSKSSHADRSNQIKINLTGVLYANMLLQVRLTKDCDMQHVSVRNQKTLILFAACPRKATVALKSSKNHTELRQLLCAIAVTPVAVVIVKI